MCGGCGWKVGEYSCDTWLLDGLKAAGEDEVALAAALQQSALTTVRCD